MIIQIPRGFVYRYILFNAEPDIICGFGTKAIIVHSAKKSPKKLFLFLAIFTCFFQKNVIIYQLRQ